MTTSKQTIPANSPVELVSAKVEKKRGLVLGKRKKDRTLPEEHDSTKRCICFKVNCLPSNHGGELSLCVRLNAGLEQAFSSWQKLDIKKRKQSAEKQALAMSLAPKQNLFEESESVGEEELNSPRITEGKYAKPKIQPSFPLIESTEIQPKELVVANSTKDPMIQVPDLNQLMAQRMKEIFGTTH